MAGFFYACRPAGDFFRPLVKPQLHQDSRSFRGIDCVDAGLDFANWRNARARTLDRWGDIAGIKIRPGPGRSQDNGVFVANGAWRCPGLTVKVDGSATRNRLLVGPGISVEGLVHFHGQEGLVVFVGETDWPCVLEIHVYSTGAAVIWGRGSTSNGASILAEGDGRCVTVSTDCMIARGAAIRTSDGHSITDRETGKWLNPPDDVVLGDHVWVGTDSLILKGVTIGSGAVVGAKSLVNRDVPASALVGGVPARVLREDVEWSRDLEPARGARTTDFRSLSTQTT